MEQGPAPDGHRQYEDMAVAHVLGGLGEEPTRVFRAHLLECPDCRGRVGELRAIASELADVERAERRQRAAKVLETKSRDEDEDYEDDYRGTSSRRARLLLVAGIVLVGLLASWNFLLRGNVQRMEAALQEQQDAVTVMELGDAWAVTQAAPGVNGQATSYEGDVLVVLDGLQQVPHGLYFVDEDNQTVSRRVPVAVIDGRLQKLEASVPSSAVRLVVTPATTASSDPDGDTVFEASVPAED